ncbi:MAG: glycosyltransferase family 4 protein [Rubripirellula sp.]|nr:glycosyltransferase family 4 protein [Rubripirellula sp.]
MSISPTVPNLLMIAERFPPDIGGVARSASRTAQAIARLGWNVHVLAWTKTLSPGVLETVESTAPNGKSTGVIVHRLGLFSNMDLSMQHTTNVLEWLHQQFQYSATWGHYVYPAGYMAVVFAESVGIHSTVSARGNDIDRLMFPPGDFARLMWTLDRATVVSCVSGDLAKKVEMLLNKQSEPIVIPNVVNAEIFRPARRSGSETHCDSETLSDSGNHSNAGNHSYLENHRSTGSTENEASTINNRPLRDRLGILPDEVVLGFCGELRHKKGLPFILSALLEVQQTQKACLLVIGEIRPREQTHLATFAAEHPEAADRILVSGNLETQEEVTHHFHLCDVVLQPSVWDGLPNAVLEAMACGKIVIASDAGGIPEAIVHGESGFLIQKALLNNLGTAILEVLHMAPEQRDAISKAARQRVIDHFQDEQEAERLSQVLKKLTG